MAKLYEDRFDTTQTDFENQLAMLEYLTNTYDKGMDEIEERGYLMTTKYYSAMRQVENKNLDVMKRELQELTDRMSEAVNSGTIQEGSEAWYKMQQEINGVREAIQETEVEIIKLGNSIRETLWGHFDYLQDRISRINDEAEFMIKLLSNSKQFNDNGSLTSEGMATMGLHGQNYNVYMSQADKYAKEIAKLRNEMANDPNNTKLIEQYDTWIDAQREAILNAEDEKQAIKSLVEEGIKTELSSLNDLINKYKESLDTAKSLYDYQKKVKEQSDTINKLQKQMAAYAGDDSEETRKTTQKISVDLSKAMKQLEETQYQRQISDQKQMLGELYDQYDLVLNSRLDNLDALMADMIQMINLNSGSTKESIAALKDAEGGYVNVINGQISTVNTTSQTGFDAVKERLGLNNGDNQKAFVNIKDTLTNSANNVGYTMTSEMRSLWDNDGKAKSIITQYGDKFTNQITSVQNTLNTISATVGSMVKKSDETAKKTTTTTKTTTPASTTAKPPTTTTTTAPKPAASAASGSGGDGVPKVGDKVKYVSGSYYRDSAGKNPSGTQHRGEYVYISKVYDKGAYPIHISSKQESSPGSASLGWVKLAQLEGYASGLRSSGKNQWALTDEKGMEALISPANNAIVTHVNKGDSILTARATKNLFDLANAPDGFYSLLRDLIEGKTSIFGGGANASTLKKIHPNLPNGLRKNGIGDVTYQINIPIDHVEDYDDFVNKMRTDNKFEKLIQSMTIDQLNGKTSMAKNKYKW